MNITANVTAALQSSWKTIRVALKFAHGDDDDETKFQNKKQEMTQKAQLAKYSPDLADETSSQGLKYQN